MDSLQFSHITTRGGDEGKTSLINGERRFKSEIIFEVLGDIDELSSALGVFKAHLASAELLPPTALALVSQIHVIQKNLVLIGGQVATPPPLTSKKNLSDTALEELEQWEHELIHGIVMKGFIIPGGSILTASGDIARAVCRRAERHLVQYIQGAYAIGFEPCQKYLNRLSDYLFVLCRQIAQTAGTSEI